STSTWAGAFHVPTFELRPPNSAQFYTRWQLNTDTTVDVRIVNPLTGTGMVMQVNPNANFAVIGNNGMTNPDLYTTQFFSTLVKRLRIENLEGPVNVLLGRANGSNYVGGVTPGYGLSFDGTNLTADTSSANGLATQYDLTTISGSGPIPINDLLA